MRLSHILSIWWHELVDILHDEGILIFVIFVPLAYPLLYSWVYTNEVVREVPAAVVDDCNSSITRQYLRQVDATPDVRLVARCTDMDEARRLVERHEAYGIIHIPESFDRDLVRGDQTTIGLYCDMSSMLYYKALLLANNNVSLGMNKHIKVSRYLPGTTDRQEEISRTPIEFDYTALYNPQGGFAAFLIPPVLMLIIHQTMILGIGMQMGRSRERNLGCTIPFHRAYKNPVSIVLGKSLVYVMIYMVMAVYMYVWVSRWFGLPMLGHARTFAAFIVPYLLACAFFGITLSSLIYRREDCILLFVFMSVPLLFISGITWPRQSMPALLRHLSFFFPSTPGINGYVRLASMGASLHEIRTEVMQLWGQTLLYFITACLMYRHEIGRMLRRVDRKRFKPLAS